MDEAAVHDKTGVDQGRVYIESGHAKHSGDFQVEVQRPVSGYGPGAVERIAIELAAGAIGPVDNLRWHVVLE